MKQLQQIHNIINSGFKLARIETTRYDTVVNLFSQYCNQVKKHLFLWQQGTGLNRLSGKQIVLNNTRLLTEAIDFIEAAPDFGVYILKDFPARYPVRISYQLQEIMAPESVSNCLIILMGASLPLDSVLGKYALTIQCGSQQPGTVGAQSSVRQQQQFNQQHNRF